MVELRRAYRKLETERGGTDEMLRSLAKDYELYAMAEEERNALDRRLDELREKIRL